MSWHQISLHAELDVPEGTSHPEGAKKLASSAGMYLHRVANQAKQTNNAPEVLTDIGEIPGDSFVPVDVEHGAVIIFQIPFRQNPTECSACPNEFGFFQEASVKIPLCRNRGLVAGCRSPDGILAMDSANQATTGLDVSGFTTGCALRSDEADYHRRRRHGKSPSTRR